MSLCEAVVPFDKISEIVEIGGAFSCSWKKDKVVLATAENKGVLIDQIIAGRGRKK